MDINTDHYDDADQHETPVLRAAAIDDVAYIVYTSGSAGQPKGVAVTHRAATSLLRAHARNLVVDASARVAHFVSPAFDVAVLELLLAHGTGATAVVVPPGLIGGADLADYLRAERVTHFLSTPAVASSMDPSGLPDLRMLNVGGESPSPDLIERWSPYVGVVNSYGPTEASVTAFMSEPLGPGAAAADRPAHRRRLRRCAGCTSAAERNWSNRRTVCDGPRTGTRIRAPRWPNRRKVCCGAVRRPVESHVPNRRPRAVDGRAPARICRARRPSGQDSWCPGRTR